MIGKVVVNPYQAEADKVSKVKRKYEEIVNCEIYLLTGADEFNV